jgi:hypothetical protein
MEVSNFDTNETSERLGRSGNGAGVGKSLLSCRCGTRACLGEPQLFLYYDILAIESQEVLVPIPYAVFGSLLLPPVYKLS